MNAPNEAPTSGLAKELDFEVPPFPAVASRLLKELKSDEVKIPSVVQLIECEPKIHCRVLDLANSPLYGAKRPIKSIGHAVVLLGFQSVAQLSLAVAAGSIFQSDNSAVGVARGQTYVQSLAIGAVARVIASELHPSCRDDAFLCGIMHDIGKLILLDLHGDSYADLLKADHSNQIDIERERYQLTHPDLGEYCGQSWGLEGNINRSIKEHHEVFDEALPGLSQTIILSNAYARIWGIGFAESPELQHQFDEKPVFSAERLDELMAQCKEQFDAIQEICS